MMVTVCWRFFFKMGRTTERTKKKKRKSRVCRLFYKGSCHLAYFFFLFPLFESRLHCVLRQNFKDLTAILALSSSVSVKAMSKIFKTMIELVIVYILFHYIYSFRCFLVISSLGNFFFFYALERSFKISQNLKLCQP